MSNRFPDLEKRWVNHHHHHHVYINRAWERLVRKWKLQPQRI